MSRAVHGVGHNSLAKLAERYKLPPKGTAVNNTRGMGNTLPASVEKELAEYCDHDVSLCEQVFAQLLYREGRGMFPDDELDLIDMTLRMYTNPLIELDADILTKTVADDNERLQALLERCQIAEEDLASNPKFAALLESMGVEPPKKKSKTTGKMTYAFAKSDAMFQAIVGHPNEDVALLAQARLATKSTLMRTRSARLLDVASRGALPVPLNYYGAATGRWTGSESLNLQNLKRGSALRMAMQAPQGHVFVVCDLSQIEPRVLAWLSDYAEMLAMFGKEDAYAVFGAVMFGIPGMTKESHPVLRQSAKSAMLGAGYGLGWASFAQQLLTGFLGAPPLRYDAPMFKQLGGTRDDLIKFYDNNDYVERMDEIQALCTREELLIHCCAAKKIIDKYRAAAGSVKEFWSLCQSLLETTMLNGDAAYEYKGLVFDRGRITLPNDMDLLYEDLRVIKRTDDKGKTQRELVYGPHEVKLYGSKLVENIVQAMARIVMTDGMRRIAKRYPIVLSVHDEVVCVVPLREKKAALEWVAAQMIVEPEYMQGIPLACTIDAAVRYGEAK
jgi:DNA polymerase